ncbi:MAG: hypothetical protein AAB330_02160, partial [Bacteroidota bacterium]
TMGFGTLHVRGRRRVPNPPAMMTAFIPLRGEMPVLKTANFSKSSQKNILLQLPWPEACNIKDRDFSKKHPSTSTYS